MRPEGSQTPSQPSWGQTRHTFPGPGQPFGLDQGLYVRVTKIEDPTVDALQESFEEHYVGLVRFCLGLTGEAGTAEDLAQEAFVRAAVRIEGVDPGKRGAYLRRAALNTWRKRLRRLAIERRHAERDDIAPDDHDPSETMAIWTAVLALPIKQRACIILRYFEDRSERETAEALGISIGTVKSHTARALGKLRREFT